MKNLIVIDGLPFIKVNSRNSTVISMDQYKQGEAPTEDYSSIWVVRRGEDIEDGIYVLKPQGNFQILDKLETFLIRNGIKVGYLTLNDDVFFQIFGGAWSLGTKEWPNNKFEIIINPKGVKKQIDKILEFFKYNNVFIPVHRYKKGEHLYAR